MRIALVGNARSTLDERSLQAIRGCDAVVAADGGGNLCFRYNIRPKAIVGDFDSLVPTIRAHYEDQAVFFEKHPASKSKTDLELSFEYAQSLGASEVLVFAWSDERIDYSMEALRAFSNSRIPVRLYGFGFEGILLNNSRSNFQTERLNEGRSVSVLPLQKPIALKTKGLKWELDWSDAQQDVCSQSNECVGNSLSISVEKGACLLLLSTENSGSKA